MAWISLTGLFIPEWTAAIGIVRISNEEFILANSMNRIINKYNIRNNKWTVFYDASKSSHIQSQAFCYDPHHKNIYFPSHSLMRVINTESKTETDYPLSLGSIGPVSSLIIMDLVCHIIGGRHNDSHYIWNDKEKNVQKIHAFNGLDGKCCVSFGLIYVSRKKELFRLGGFYWDTCDRTDEILKYSVHTGKWTLLNVKLPHKMNHFGCAITKEQRYIIILGGIGENNGDSDSIYIFDVVKVEILKSKISFPFKGDCKAIVMDNKYENDLLVHGFVRHSMDLYEMNVPFAIISLITIWHSTEYVHVIKTYSLKHWKIKIDNILQTNK